MDQRSKAERLERGSFSYPAEDDQSYLTYYRGQFSSVFVATSPFLHIPQVVWSPPVDWMPDEVVKLAKKQGLACGLSWREIARWCGFSSLSMVGTALRGTGSKRLVPRFSNAENTSLLLQICKKANVFLPDEGRFSPLSEISIWYFLQKAGHHDVIVANHFGINPRKLESVKFSEIGNPELDGIAELWTKDGSMYLSMYTDYHYFLVCQDEESRHRADPAEYFDGFSATKETNDLWSVAMTPRPSTSSR